MDPMTGRYQWLVVLTSGWLVAGGWIDAWAHHRTSVETFFTPWHAVLYSGFLASAAVVVSPAVVRLVRRSTESPALPPGFGLSVLGLLLFALAGAGDALWHTIFGIEEDIEALLSPPHLMLGAGAFLIVSGPARAAWRDLGEGAGSGWKRLGPPLLSTAMVLSLATFLTEYANPLSIPLAAGDGITRLADFGLGSEDFVGSETLKQGLGVAGILVLAVLIAGASAVVLRWPRRFGALTILLTVGLAPSLLPHQVVAFLPVVVGGGLGCDVLARLLRPAPARSLAWRGFSFLGPAIFFGLYFTAVALSVGLAWTPELWLGSIMLAGSAGLLLGLLHAP
jgi:hypothetical protein